MHLALDLFGCNPDCLNDRDLVWQFLQECPARLDMEIIDGPHVTKAPPDQYSDNYGWSGFVIIAESHIVVHTFPGRDGYANVDVFSCKSFDVEESTSWIQGLFQAERVDSRLLNRGLEWLDTAQALALEHRAQVTENAL